MKSLNIKENSFVQFHQKIGFKFDGKKYYGFKGDTVASALLRNNIRIPTKGCRVLRHELVTLALFFCELGFSRGSLNLLHLEPAVALGHCLGSELGIHLLGPVGPWAPHHKADTPTFDPPDTELPH